MFIVIENNPEAYPVELTPRPYVECTPELLFFVEADRIYPFITVESLDTEAVQYPFIKPNMSFFDPLSIPQCSWDLPISEAIAWVSVSGQWRPIGSASVVANGIWEQS